MTHITVAITPALKMQFGAVALFSHLPIYKVVTLALEGNFRTLPKERRDALETLS